MHSPFFIELAFSKDTHLINFIIQFSVDLHLSSVDVCVTVYFTEVRRVKNENH